MKAHTCTPMAVLLQVLLVAFLYNAAPTTAARPGKPQKTPSPSPSPIACAAKVAGCNTCTTQNKLTVCSACSKGAALKKGGGSCECPSGFGSRVAVPVPGKRDPDYSRLFNKQAAYNKVYDGKSCQECPDEYATGKDVKLEFSAAVCKPCASGKAPDAHHALCVVPPSGCKAFPCKNGKGSATCKNKAGASKGRACTCSVGYTYKDDTSGCVDVDACINHGCTNGAGTATCRDLKAPAPDSSAGRTCSCGTGFTYLGDKKGCAVANVNACIHNPCTSGTSSKTKATCTDLPPPAKDTREGRTCTCRPGYTYQSDALGCIVPAVNACTKNGCAGPTSGPASATCADLPGNVDSPKGRTCTCKAGYFYKDEINGCANVNACTANPCTKGDAPAVNCTDKPPPKLDNADGRTCSCPPGYAYTDDDSGCTDIDACENNSCSTAGNDSVECQDLPPPAPGNATGRMCVCDADSGYTYFDDKKGCVDANACINNPCANGSTPATCRDLPAPDAVDDVDGRTCTCPPGYSYDEETGCTDINACDNNSCSDGDDTGVCTDKAAPALDNANGRTCSCETDGFVYKNDTYGCMDFNACAAFPCKAGARPLNATCDDIPGPDGAMNATGRTCSCNDGYVYASDRLGCVDLDACAVSPCTNGTGANATAICQDLPPPALDDTDGRTCSCRPGFTYADDDSGCVDIDACADNPCNDGDDSAECVDLLPPANNSAAGRTCTCGTDGFVYANETYGCADFNACAAHPCNNQTGAVATCDDIPGPDGALNATGRTCSCSDGFTYANDTLGCVDLNACLTSPCTNGNGTAICSDLPPPALDDSDSRTCSCNAGFTYVDDDTGCTEINACDTTPCNDGDDAAGCVDLPPPALGDAAGRICSCDNPGFVYANDTYGCTDANACAAYPCTSGADVAVCEDIAAPVGLLNPLGRTCFCSDSFTYANDTFGCMDVNACINNPCTNGNGTATCTDLPPPGLDDTDGRICSCNDGFGYADDDSGCTEINACEDTPCNDGDDTANCSDLQAPAPGGVLGRTCSCQSAGFYYANETYGCADVDACDAYPCINGTGVASCADLPPPSGSNPDGRTCSCDDGFVYKNDTAGCIDIDACVGNPCNNGNGTASCADQPAPALDTADGRTCSCTTGFEYADDVSGCTDIDACDAAACTDGDDTALCVDLPAPSLGDAAGRTCSCKTSGFSYADDARGCVAA